MAGVFRVSKDFNTAAPGAAELLQFVCVADEWPLLLTLIYTKQVSRGTN